MRLANNRLEANPNSDRMTAKRKVRCGRQFSRLHSRVARAAASITGCRANVHTPQPVSAMASEAMPETVMEYRFICVNGLKRICLFSMVLCMIVSALMGSARKMTADSSTSLGWLKKRAISGEQPISTPYSRILIPRLNQKTELNSSAVVSFF